jgi:hypothetical protein
MTPEQAASLAKNLTVNFNRKGQVAQQANAMFAFFNAAVQGTARMARNLNGPAGRKIIGGGLLLGSLQAFVLLAAGYGDDEPPEFVKAKNIVIPLPGGSYVTVPMPLGYSIIPTFSRLITEFCIRGFKKPGHYATEMVAALFDTFNPIGSAGISMQTVLPTAMDPAAALMENRNWNGQDIAIEDRDGSKPTPGMDRAKASASWLGKMISHGLNNATFGNDYKAGVISPTPDQIDYLIGWGFGGVGREALKVQQSGAALLTGEDLPPSRMPLVGRFYGNTTGQQSVMSEFRTNVKDLNVLELELDGRIKAKDGVAAFKRANPDVALVEQANAVERQVSELRRRKRKLIEDGASKDKVKLVEQQITAKMRAFNEKVEKAREAR